MLVKVISGGQTGVGRAGLDAAMEANIPVGGACPKGRKAEDGAIPEQYPLTELKTVSYTIRSERNARDSDATLILNLGGLSGATAKTREYAHQHGRPYLVLQLEQNPDPHEVRHWLEQHQVRVLNIAGPRESKRPGIYTRSLAFLREVLV
mgnify:CR=1 FL=1|jgi:hypothetical protein